ncbi:retrovirus-related pol polyprotein from transposon TNT 1-94 [Tanacetum coccineum]
MSSNSDDIQAAGSDTRPPMLDRTDYESWSQRIRLYCRGKENGLQILQSIDQGPFELGTTRNTLGTTPEGGVLLGPERPRTYEDLSDTEKKRYDADVRATNIVLQGLPKDIYKLINHNIEAKAIWDNVKMLLAGSELTKEDRESQLYDEFERFKMLPGENINEYYVRFHKLVNDMRNIRMTMPNIQLNSKFMNNMSPKWDRETLPQTNNQLRTSSNTQNQATIQDARVVVQNVQERQNQRYFARGNGPAGNRGAQNRAGNANAGQGKPVKCYNCNGVGKVLSYLCFESLYVFYTTTDSVLNVSRFSDMHDAFTSAQKRIADLESENFNLRNKIQNDDHDSMIKHFSKLEVEHFNLQLKYQNLKERFGNKKPVTSSDAPSFDSLFVIGKLNEQIQSRGNTIHELKEKISRLTKKNSDTDPTFDLKALVSQNKDLTAKLNALHDLNECFRAENAKVKQHYKELYDSIKITRAKTTDQNNSLLSEIEHLKDQLKENSKCVTIPDCKPKVLAPGRYPIDVEPIPPRLKKNREVHLHYIKRLKENVETLREIVEDAKVERPLDTSLASACRVNGASAASKSKPRSNTKKDRTLPAKSALKQVEAHSMMNKSNEKHKNRGDSSISYKRIVINLNSITSCKTCNKCLISVNHDQCVVRSEMCVKQSSATKVWRVKHVKQVWKATGKLFTTIGHQWRPTGRLLPLGDQWPLTRNTPPKVLPTKQWKPTSKLLPLGRQCPLVRSTALKCNCLPADPQETSALVVQIVLWYLDSGCSKHMTGDRSRLRNFVKKFIGTVRFGNDHFGAIMGYGDYVIGDSVISRVYYVEGLGHNLFSVGQFCDSDLEVAFRKHTCFVRDLEGVDLIKGSHGTNLYTISVEDMMRSSPICLLSKASKNKSWLWHRHLNHLNFGTLNDLARKDLVRGLPRLKFEKDHLCSACQLGKSRKATHKPKTINTITEVLHTLHMDLCGPLRVQSINGKKYILVIVDDYSRFTWVKFLRSKDETPVFVINLLKQLQVGLNKTVRFVRTDNGTEFVNKNLTDFYESVGITHEKTVPRTPQQNGVVERRNHTLVEAARTMLIFSKAPLFLWAEAVATACYTQNRSLIHTLHNKTPYELVHDKKPDLSFLRIFGALCYPTNDSEDLGKLKAKADIGFFVGYAPNRKGYRIYNKRTRQIMETIHVTFDELTEQTAPIHSSSGPNPILLTPRPISSGLVPNSAPAIPYVPPTNKDLELLFQPMFDEYFETPTGDHQMPHVPAVPPPVIPTGPSVSISFDHDAPSGSHSPSSSAHQSSSVHHGVATEHSFEVNPFAATEHEPFVNVFAPDPNSEASSSGHKYKYKLVEKLAYFS